MGQFWASSGYSNSNQDLRRSTQQIDYALQIRELEHEVQRLMLMNQAMWELIRERLQLTDPELEKKFTEIDLRDGVQDGEMTITPLKCPSCGRISSSRRWKCMYCGQQFEKPVMG